MVLVLTIGVLLSLGIRCHRAGLLRRDRHRHWEVDPVCAQASCQLCHLDGKVRSSPSDVTVRPDHWLASGGVGWGEGRDAGLN